MAKVSLRAYDREIEGLIEQGQRLDEAVAHCRHILKSYPKHLETYRLLGKAYLEAKRYDQAVDIFRRVLVASPEDFVSHVGMSIIGDDQGKLDEAIWHMERAFEVQPSNAAIQAELQRLFGRRDGVEPPKIRLTRGALAHMYVQGELFTQAISEIRAVLANDKNRMDMQVLLARAYARNGQKAEAGEVCSALLAISPYCLEANRLMGEVLPGAQPSEAAREYRRRVFELDPYAEFAQGPGFNSESVADSAVTLERLEYVGGAAEPGVALGLGLESGSGTADRAAVPSWLRARPDTGNVAEQPEPAHADVPDFMLEAGWHEVDATAADGQGAEEAGEEEEAQAVPGDLPDWVKALAPTAESEVDGGAADLDWQSPTGGEPLAPSESMPVPAAAGTTDYSPDWLKDLASGADQADKKVSGEAETSIAFGSDEAPEVSATSTASAEQDDALAWLEGLAEKHGAKPEELLTSPEARRRSPPEWIDQASQGADDSGRGWMPPPAVTPEDQQGSIQASEPATPAQDQKPFDWLSGLSDQNTFTDTDVSGDLEQPPIMEEPDALAWTKQGAESIPPAEDRISDDLVPMRDLTSPPERETSGEYQSAVDLPDWLAGLDAQKPPSPAPAVQEPDEVELPDWLKADAPVSPGVGRGTTPEWVPDQSYSKPAAEPAETVDVPAPAAIPSRTRPMQPAEAMSGLSLSGAQTELGRGNIAAALDIYGRLIRRGKSLEEIIRNLRDALYRYPVEVPIWQALGDAYMRANRLQDALDAYTKAEELLR